MTRGFREGMVEPAQLREDRRTLRDAALVMARFADSGVRTDLDSAMEAFGFTREELEAQVATELRALADVIEKMGRLYEDLEAVREPAEPDAKPEWLTKALEAELHLSREEMADLSEAEAKQRIMEHWSAKGS